MITKDLLKTEIDNVPEENLGVLLKIIKALEEPVRAPQSTFESRAQWLAFIADTFGSTSDAPLERGEQGSYEVREPLL
ncbi:MAG: hypothetical protein WAM82_12350 [Thermoanaerobaculia bacterium]